MIRWWKAWCEADDARAVTFTGVGFAFLGTFVGHTSNSSGWQFVSWGYVSLGVLLFGAGLLVIVLDAVVDD
jgi:protein-S-isoprenylcysteine O-methyltransferase Ste14